jgi:hypothetical protein
LVGSFFSRIFHFCAANETIWRFGGKWTQQVGEIYLAFSQNVSTTVQASPTESAILFRLFPKDLSFFLGTGKKVSNNL